MVSQIPEDFGSEWEMSDVVLHTLDSDGKKLHFNKSTLAVFSSYFQAMFFSNFKEANETNIVLQCDYAALKEILGIIRHLGHQFTAKGKKYDLKMLQDIYTVADMYDFPAVRQLCEDQMDCPSVEMANIAYSLGLHDILMKNLTNMVRSSVARFISKKNSSNLGLHPVFSKADVAVIYQKLLGSSLVSPSYNPVPIVTLNLEKISREVENPRIDLNQKWPMSNVSLATNSSKGRILHSSKAVLASVSPHFHKMFYENQAPQRITKKNKKKNPVITVDVEYSTMKQILSIIHHCNTNFSRFDYDQFHPVLLYDMFLAAAEDKLHIPMIRDFCCDYISEQKEGVLTLEVAVKLGFPEIMSNLVNKLPAIDLLHWVLNDTVTVFRLLHENGKGVIVTKKEEQVLSCHDLRNVQYRLRELLTSPAGVSRMTWQT